MSTFIVKGTASNAAATLSDSTVGSAQFVRIVTTAAANTITIKDTDTNVLGTVYLHAAGDSVIIEKTPSDTVSSSGNASAAAVGSPRS